MTPESIALTLLFSAVAGFGVVTIPRNEFHAARLALALLVGFALFAGGVAMLIGIGGLA